MLRAFVVFCALCFAIWSGADPNRNWASKDCCFEAEAVFDSQDHDPSSKLGPFVVGVGCVCQLDSSLLGLPGSIVLATCQGQVCSPGVCSPFCEELAVLSC